MLPSLEHKNVTSLPHTAWAQLSRVIAEHLGLHFPPERWPDLERGIRRAARESERADVLAYVQDLLSSPPDREVLDALAVQLTVGETYFFREKPIFEALQQRILPELIGERRATRHLRLWSAGCASGEEPYSLAIVLSKLIPDITEWQIMLLATDINPRALRQAADAIYGEWSFRGIAPAIKHTYFQPVARGRRRVRPEIRRLVSLARLNLAEDVYPSPANQTHALDLILCCNVLMYFAPEQARRVVERFHRCLREGGWLIVGPSEVSHTLFSSFTSINLPGAIIYRKEAGREQARLLSSARGSQEARERRTRLTWGHLELLGEDDSHCAEAAATTTLAQEQGLAEHQARQRPESHSQEMFLTPALPKSDGLPLRLDASVASSSPKEPERASSEREVSLTLVVEARSLYRQGRGEEAREKLLESLRHHPRPEAMRLLARISADRRELTDALAWCDRAIAEEKLAAESHYLRALILEEIDQTEEAIRSLRRVLYLDRHHALAHVALGHLLWRQQRQREARKHLETALSLLADRPEQRLSDADSLTTGDVRALVRSLLDGDIRQ